MHISTNAPALSIVIPAYNAARFITNSISILSDYLKSLPVKFEIIVVDDMSTDDTLNQLNRLTDLPLYVISHSINLGKFGAIKTGVAQSKGECVIFTDADIPFDLSALGYIAEQILARRIHLVIGDRALPESNYHEHRTVLRQIATSLFSHLVRALVTGGLYDTQCGLKGLRADIARAIFPLVTDNRFAGDVELLYIALKYNLEIKRIPVRLQRSEPSTVSVLRHGVEMLAQISKLKRNWRAGLYDSPSLKSLSAQQYWR